MTDSSTIIDPQERLRSAAALVHAATTELLSTQAAPEHATDLIDLHLVEGRIRSLLDAHHQEVPTVLVTDCPGTLLREARQLLDALPEDERSALSETHMLLQRCSTWADAL